MSLQKIQEKKEIIRDICSSYPDIQSLFLQFLQKNYTSEQLKVISETLIYNSNEKTIKWKDGKDYIKVTFDKNGNLCKFKAKNVDIDKQKGKQNIVNNKIKANPEKYKTKNKNTEQGIRKNETDKKQTELYRTTDSKSLSQNHKKIKAVEKHTEQTLSKQGYKIDSKGKSINYNSENKELKAKEFEQGASVSNISLKKIQANAEAYYKSKTITEKSDVTRETQQEYKAGASLGSKNGGKLSASYKTAQKNAQGEDINRFGVEVAGEYYGGLTGNNFHAEAGIEVNEYHAKASIGNPSGNKKAELSVDVGTDKHSIKTKKDIELDDKDKTKDGMTLNQLISQSKQRDD